MEKKGGIKSCHPRLVYKQMRGFLALAAAAGEGSAQVCTEVRLTQQKVGGGSGLSSVIPSEWHYWGASGRPQRWHYQSTGEPGEDKQVRTLRHATARQACNTQTTG